ncbi:2-phosphosulfolactate phosphatase [Candidatus Bathyarchaeota archaeon]|nr:2-phosphosulfolactate phosphatase [Candidatus Bathyarchaeota archaeon]MBL7167057.1 2-phosphosulfolactate phosphatase [Candidatus Bathyarchaeota archaeon]
MEIRRLSTVEGAREARGLTVIIDVFRAFTTDAFVMANGAETIHPVLTVEEARELRRLHPDWLLMGEREGIKVEGFDYGNSPHEIRDVDFTGKTLIQTTGSGTRGIVNAVGADEIILGSFVMARAIVDYIKEVDPDEASLVAMGWNGNYPAIEDELCAEYLEGRLKGQPKDFGEMKGRIRADPQGAKFFDPSLSQFVEGDFHAAMDLDRFDFVLRVEGRKEQPFVTLIP